MLTVWENPGKNAIWRELGQGRKRKPRAGEGGEQREGWLVSETERVQETQGIGSSTHRAHCITVTGPVTTRAGGTLVRRKLDMFHLLTVYCVI